MSTKVLTPSDLYEIYKAEVVARGSDIVDFSDGSLQDISTGALTTGLNEVSELMITEFLKTFFGSAEGDDLEFLAIDHYGDRFARPDATKSTTSVTFTRPNSDKGDVLIADDVIVKTEKDASGKEVRFKISSSVTLTGLTLNVPVESVEEGTETRVSADKITVIESALLDDSITVNNTSATAGGEAEQDDEEYRETISNLLLSLSGATIAAIRGAVEAVADITYVAIITTLQKVRNVDDGGVPYGDIYKIPFVTIYVADSEGNYSPSLLLQAEVAILPVRAAGVKITIDGAVSVILNWISSITLNPAGPNYAELSEDTKLITDDMANYIDQVLKIGEGFNRTSANDYILSIWGPEGTGDLTSFITSQPTGNIAGVEGTKLISGNTETI